MSYPRFQRSRDFKRTVYRHSANYTTSSSTFASIDATNLPALGVYAETGDVVLCTFVATFGHNAAGNTIRVDWLIDQPTSADTAFRTLNGGAGAGVIELGTNSLDCNNAFFRGLFTATESGQHTFLPQWNTGGGTASIINTGVNSSAVSHLVQNLGPVDPN